MKKSSPSGVNQLTKFLQRRGMTRRQAKKVAGSLGPLANKVWKNILYGPMSTGRGKKKTRIERSMLFDDDVNRLYPFEFSPSSDIHSGMGDFTIEMAFPAPPNYKRSSAKERLIPVTDLQLGDDGFYHVTF